jgi:hypothetical protein
MKKLLIVAVLAINALISYGQGELNEQQKIFFRNEKSFAILLNSNGIGLSYRDAKRIDFLNKRFFEIEAGSLKHPKEYKISNPYSQTGSFVFGKMNSTFYLRGSLGKQHEIFKKADLGGVAIRYFYEGGPVLGLYKPIYYRVLYQNPNNINELQIREEKFESSFSLPQEIYSKASFFKGIKETKVMPGLYTKAGFNFEYSKEDKIIHAIEVGGTVNAFPKKIPIMAGTGNHSIFFSLFVSYRFGIVVDPLRPESNKISNFMRRKRATQEEL